MNKREKVYLTILLKYLEEYSSSATEVAVQELKKLQSGQIYRGPMDPDDDTMHDIWRYEARVLCEMVDELP